MYGFKQAVRLETTPVLRTNYHPNSSPEQMPCSREEWGMGTQVIPAIGWHDPGINIKAINEARCVKGLVCSGHEVTN